MCTCFLFFFQHYTSVRIAPSPALSPYTSPDDVSFFFRTLPCMIRLPPPVRFFPLPHGVFLPILVSNAFSYPLLQFLPLWQFSFFLRYDSPLHHQYTFSLFPFPFFFCSSSCKFVSVRLDSGLPSFNFFIISFFPFHYYTYPFFVD